ncbi:hypothetical protein JKF63_06969 [Porcisia hertigi]|uniref:Myotubularin-related 12-like C-terminal domain-containing protein n=1 Tax=Porcisia hertigi TaxID=2761500 RepID=A0A836IEU5_9TRYP|nr:hypothetical protein JKF63_06969 [Porcisia hertigi]
MPSTLAHDLQQFRYVTAPANPLPWPHVRHVSVPELRHEAPDLPLMANLISGLCDCDVSLKEIREHNDADILQLLQVFQACLQFALWSQNILKEKLVEVQSTHAAKRVSAQQLENLEKRHHALEREMEATRKERDTLSLGTANLRTSLLQMETTIKLQERQLRQERIRSTELVAKLEKALCSQASAGPLVSRPGLPHPQEPQQRPGRNRHTSRSPPTRPRKKAAAAYNYSWPPTHDADTQRVSTASLASDTSYGDSCLPAEDLTGARSYVPRPCDSLDPPPPSFLDWRTLVRYIIHEEQKTHAWSSVQASPFAKEAVSASGMTSEKPISEKDVLTPAAPHTQEQVQSFLQELTAGITKDITEFTNAAVTRAEEVVRAVTQQRMEEAAEAQRSMMAEMRATFSSLAAELKADKQKEDAAPLPLTSTASVPTATSGVPSAHLRPAPSSPTMGSSAKRNSVAVTSLVSSQGPSSALALPTGASSTNDSKPISSVPQVSASALPPSIVSSPPSSYLNSFLTTSAPQGSLKTSRIAHNSGSKPQASLPSFSPDILRTPPTSEHSNSAAPSDADSDSSRSVTSLPPDEDVQQAGVSTRSMDNPSSDSPSDSYQSSVEEKDAAVPAVHAYSRVLTRPSSPPPVYPNRTPTPAPVSVPPGPPSNSTGQRTGNLQHSTRSDMSEISSHGSSQMLRETRAQLQALLDEEKETEAHRPPHVSFTV